MSRSALALAFAAVFAASASPAAAWDLRVCADPNNLPFSNEQRQGFENEIIELVARSIGAEVRYVWWAQRRGNVRNTLNEGRCDVIPGMASNMETAATTRPYYRSTYVFVTRADGGPEIASFDDPKLRELKVGVQLVGDDFANTPPAHALARRGIVENVRGYMLYGDYALPTPPANILKAVAEGEIDVAVVWGPLAGGLAREQKAALKLTPVSPWMDTPTWPMVFDISMGVRKDDRELLVQLDRALVQNRDAIDAILARHGVPRVDRGQRVEAAPLTSQLPPPVAEAYR